MSKLYTTALFAVLAQGGFALSVSISQYAPSMCTYATGALYANASGGTPPYTYLWSTSSVDPSISDLVAGTYSVTITDANSDEATAQYTLYADVFQTYAFHLVACPDGLLGPPFRMVADAGIYSTGTWPISVEAPWQVDLLTSGIEFEDALYIGNFSGWPAPGTELNIPFTDALGCPGVIHGTIPQPPAYPDVAVLTIDEACAGGNNGEALVQVNAAPNLDAYQIELRNNGSDYGFLPDFGNFNQFFGQLAQSSNPQWLAPGDYDMVIYPKYLEQYAWLESYFFVGDPDFGCADTVEFTVPEMPSPCATLMGTAYMDDNEDCAILWNEVRVPEAVMMIEPGGYSALTNSSGYYQINVPTGSYTIEQGPSNVNEHCVGGPIPINLPTNGMTVTQNMADTALLARDVALEMSSGPARPGFAYTAWIGIDNITTGGTGTVTLSCTFDPLLVFVSASPSPTVNGNTLTWTMSQITSFGFRAVSMQFQVPPNAGLIGTDLVFSATVGIAQPETDLSNNTITHTRTVTGSYDPNDKLATTSSQWSSDLYYIDGDEWIDYTIRFQNTGTDTAFNVVITDTLPPTLDPATFELGVRSHACIPQMSGQGILRFVFPNIQLPDSNTNEPASHGLVQFRIKPKQPLMLGTAIENVANIYFDYNEPVITEPSLLTAEFSTDVSDAEHPTGLLIPNPATDRVRFSDASIAASVRSWEVVSSSGALVLQGSGLIPASGIAIGQLENGAYFLRMHTKNEVHHERFIKISQ